MPRSDWLRFMAPMCGFLGREGCREPEGIFRQTNEFVHGAAELLGVKATTLKARIKKMGLKRPV